jgi:hypothetical protein
MITGKVLQALVLPAWILPAYVLQAWVLQDCFCSLWLLLALFSFASPIRC